MVLDQRAVLRSNTLVWVPVFLLILIVWGFAYRHTLGTLWTEWAVAGGPYGHGWFVVAMSAYILWQRHAGVAFQARGYRGIGALLSIGFGLLWWLAESASIAAVAQPAIILLFNSVFFTVFGWRSYRRVMLPLLLPLLVVSIWDLLRTPLRDLSTVVAVQLVRWADVPVVLQGYMVSVPGGRFFIEDSCAGLNFFLTSLVLGISFTYLNEIQGIRRFGYVLGALIIAVLANWLRITLIILIGSWTEMRHPIVQDHLTFGWVLYCAVIAPAIWGANRWFGSGHKVGRPSLKSTAAPLPVGRGWRWLAAGVVLLLLFPAFAKFDAQHARHTYVELQPPKNLSPEWRESFSPLVDWQPRFVGASSEYLHSYARADQTVTLYVANYREQSQGRELVGTLNRLFDEAQWNSLGGRSIAVAAPPYSYRLVHLQSGGAHRFVAYSYVVAGHIATSPAKAKMLQILGNVTGNRQASIVAIAVDAFDEDGAAVQAQLSELLVLAYSQLSHAAPEKTDSP